MYTDFSCGLTSYFGALPKLKSIKSQLAPSFAAASDYFFSVGFGG
jgi:hypothetical protein